MGTATTSRLSTWGRCLGPDQNKRRLRLPPLRFFGILKVQASIISVNAMHEYKEVVRKWPRCMARRHSCSMRSHPHLCAVLVNCILERRMNDAALAISAVFGKRCEFRVIDSYPKGYFYRWSHGGLTELIEFPALATTEASVLVERFVDSFELIERCHDFNDAVLVNLDDASRGFGLGFCDNQHFENLIPDSEFIASRGHSKAAAVLNRTDWGNRKDTVFWRGSTTGYQKGNNALDLPRVRLCRLSFDKPDQFDFRITDIVQIDTHEERLKVVKSGIMGERVSWSTWTNYKYHVDIDGNSSSWTGLYYKLLSGGVVLKIASPFDFRQWYYPKLIPWKNFVPVANIDDLPTTISLLKRDESLAQAVGAAGRELAQSLTFDSEMALAAKAFRNYARVHN